ncbi:polyphenol oxidase family protein [bacterium]|jgi:polyphenol oxidase|nr:polyphenol oxidase family protein [bacterium]
MDKSKRDPQNRCLEKLIDEPTLFTLQTTVGFGLDDVKKKYSFPLATMTQVHGNAIANLDDINDGIDGGHIEDVDGLITSKKGLAISVKTADCLPILIYHPSGVIAGLHAGRRGTEQKILVEALDVFRTRYGLESGFQIWFGPCICKKCYQIDRSFDLHYDLDGENKRQLDAVLSESDYVLTRQGQCTSCTPSLFYSYRRSNGDSSRHYSLIALVTT